MLTGNQIAAARRLAGFSSQAKLAEAAGISQMTLTRAEAAKANIPTLDGAMQVKLVLALEQAGIEFFTHSAQSLVGGLEFRLRQVHAE